MDYEKDIKIDETALDTEWLEQPRLMIQYSQYTAQAQKEMEYAKENLEVVRAELDKEIRSEPEKFDVNKLTETVVQNTILLQERYREANKEYLEARYEYEMAKNAIRAFDQRKDALENLVRLYGQQYFAGPNAPRDLSKEWEQKEKQRNADKRVKMRRSK